MNNPGFIVTAKGVVIVDPGSSLEPDMVCPTRWRQSGGARPFVSGGDPRPQTHDRTGAKRWGRMLDRTVSENAGGVLGNSVAPTVGLNGGEVLDFGEAALRIMHTGKTHADHDLMTEVLQGEPIYLGGNQTVFCGRCP